MNVEQGISKVEDSTLTIAPSSSINIPCSIFDISPPPAATTPRIPPALTPPRQPRTPARVPLALTVSSRHAYDDSSADLNESCVPSARDESLRFVAHHLIFPPWSFSMVVSRLRLCLTTLSLTAGVLVASHQTLAAPVLTTTSPQAVAPGGQTDVKVRGSGLVGATRLWSGFSGTAILSPDVKDNGKNAAETTWRLNVPAGSSGWDSWSAGRRPRRCFIAEADHGRRPGICCSDGG